MNRDQYNAKREQHQHVVVAAMQASIHGVPAGAQRETSVERWPRSVVADDDRMEAIGESFQRSEIGN